MIKGYCKRKKCDIKKVENGTQIFHLMYTQDKKKKKYDIKK